jgi:hypothetical protein
MSAAMDIDIELCCAIAMGAFITRVIVYSTPLARHRADPLASQASFAFAMNDFKPRAIPET